MPTIHQHRQNHPARITLENVSLISLAVLFVSIVAIALALIGVAVRGTTPLVAIPPLAVGCWAILTIRK